MGWKARQAALSMGFPGKTTAVGSHSLLQGIFPTEIEPASPVAPVLQKDPLPSEPPGKPTLNLNFQGWEKSWRLNQLPDVNELVSHAYARKPPENLETRF